ncbi:MAG: hypothetical protein ACOCY1_00420 [Halovenus sp.]
MPRPDNCRVTKRGRAHSAARALEADPRVEGVTVVSPEQGDTDRWALDIVLDSQAGGVTTPVLYELAAAGCTIASVDRQGDGHQALATIGGGR